MANNSGKKEDPDIVDAKENALQNDANSKVQSKSELVNKPPGEQQQPLEKVDDYESIDK